MCTCNPRIWEAEAGNSPTLHSKCQALQDPVRNIKNKNRKLGRVSLCHVMGTAQVHSSLESNNCPRERPPEAYKVLNSSQTEERLKVIEDTAQNAEEGKTPGAFLQVSFSVVLKLRKGSCCSSNSS